MYGYPVISLFSELDLYIQHSILQYGWAWTLLVQCAFVPRRTHVNEPDYLATSVAVAAIDFESVD